MSVCFWTAVGLVLIVLAILVLAVYGGITLTHELAASRRRHKLRAVHG